MSRRHALLLAACLALAPASARAAEQKVTLEQLPPAVRATLEKEAKGGTIHEIEKETEHGKTVYEAEVTLDGQRWEIEIADTGKLLARERDDDKPGDDGDDDDAATPSDKQ